MEWARWQEEEKFRVHAILLSGPVDMNGGASRRAVVGDKVRRLDDLHSSDLGWQLLAGELGVVEGVSEDGDITRIRNSSGESKDGYFCRSSFYYVEESARAPPQHAAPPPSHPRASLHPPAPPTRPRGAVRRSGWTVDSDRRPPGSASDDPEETWAEEGGTITGVAQDAQLLVQGTIESLRRTCLEPFMLENEEDTDEGPVLLDSPSMLRALRARVCASAGLHACPRLRA